MVRAVVVPALSTIVTVPVPPLNEPAATGLVVVVPLIAMPAPPVDVASEPLEPFCPNELMLPLPTTKASLLMEIADVDVEVKSPSALYSSEVTWAPEAEMVSERPPYILKPPAKVAPKSATELPERLIVALGLVIAANDVLLPASANKYPFTARGEVAVSVIALG